MGHAFEVSGSCLGFEPVRGTPRHLAAFIEALRLLLLALLITYLPSMRPSSGARCSISLSNMQAGNPRGRPGASRSIRGAERGGVAAMDQFAVGIEEVLHLMSLSLYKFLQLSEAGSPRPAR